MSKSDAPALRLIVEPGPRLVPASAFDAERLDTYQVGRTIRLSPVEEADRKNIRRWWAILNRAVKDAKTPWRTPAQASEAIKLALGIVEYGKTVNGKFMQWPKSLKELDDQELTDAVRDMAAIVMEITGVDPLDWNKESSDVGRDEQEQPETQAPPPNSGSGSSGCRSPLSAAAASSDPLSDADHGAETAPDPELVRLMMEECIDTMIRDAFSEPAIERPAKIERLRAVFLEPYNLGSHAKFVDLCAETVRRIIGKPQEKVRAKDFLMSKRPV